MLKLISVNALVNVEDGEHLELVGSMSDVHIYLRGHCRKARFFNSLLWKRYVDIIEMRIVLQLPGRLFKLLRINFLDTIYNCFFGYISLLTYKAHCVGRTSFYCTNFKIISEKLASISNSPTFETILL